MKHVEAEDDIRECAALYALGSLTQTEARAFEEHVAEGCRICAGEMAEFDEVVGALACATPERSPAADLRDRLLARIGVEPQARCTESGAGAYGVEVSEVPGSAVEPVMFVLRADEGEWRETPDAGVFAKVLFVDKARETVTSLVKMSPGARVPMHRHLGIEQCLVLEGDLRAGGVTLRAGDYNCWLPDTVHAELNSEQGNLLLIVAPESFEVLAPLSTQNT